MQRELAQEEQAKRVPVRLPECDNKLIVPPPPPPGRVISGSGLTYRRAIEQGLITHAELPVGMPIDAAYEPPTPKVVVTPPENRPLTPSELGELQRANHAPAASQATTAVSTSTDHFCIQHCITCLSCVSIPRVHLPAWRIFAMWSFNWGVFWAALAAFAVAHVVTVGMPLNVTLSLTDFRAIVGKLESIESYLSEQQEVEDDN